MNSTISASQDSRAQTGEWKVLPYKSQIEAVHMALLRTGKVLYYSGFGVAEPIKIETRLWYPKIGEIKAPLTPGDFFCAGHSFLPDGRLLSTGGTLEHPYRGIPSLPLFLRRLLRPVAPFLAHTFGRLFFKALPSTTGPTFLYLFDPKTEQWEFAGDMAEGRWYPTAKTLPDGRILIVSGSNEGGGFGSHGRVDINRRLEVFSSEEGLKQVATIPVDEHSEHPFPPVYPRLHVLPLSEADKEEFPAGKIFCSGPVPQTKFLNLQTWIWTDVAQLNQGEREDGCAVLLPLRAPDYTARVLTFGGAKVSDPKLRGTETAEMIDLGKTPYVWENVPSLKDKRLNACAVLLPDGKVLAVGGNGAAQFDNPVFNVEVFDPDTRTWSQVAPITVPRGYHSTALLLPDGRVLTAGTTPFAYHELRMEVYSPYYLFKGPRPRITRIDTSIRYDQAFEVSYQYTGAIKSVALIRPGAVTHAFDMDQRYVELVSSPSGTDRLTVQVPRDEHIAPPGYYMLFVLSENGVPSEAEFVHLPVRQ
jgi:hypothetical protein